MNNRNNWYKNYILVALFVVMLLIVMVILPNNKLFSSSQGIKNQSLTKSVNIVNGITIVNGKSFFPLGLYHVSWKSTAQDLIKDMHDIAAARFNTIHASAM